MTTNFSSKQSYRWGQDSIDVQNTHPVAISCESSGYRISLASNTVIPTPQGWTTIADIRTGDSVFDEQGRTCSVAEVSEETMEAVYLVIFSDESSIVAGAHHPWITLTPTDLSPVGRSIYRPGPWDAGCWPVTTWELEQLLNSEAKMRTDTLHYIPVAGVLSLYKRDLPVHPWLLGLWLGDGDSDSATIYCSPDDEPHYRERFREIGENWRVLNPGEQVSRCSMAWGSKPRLWTRLRLFGLKHNKFIPSVHLRANQGQRLALLQGLMDSDGHVDANGRAEFTSKSCRLADGVRELALSLGMKVTVRKAKGRQGGRNVSEHYRVRFTPTMPVATLPRKAAAVMRFIDIRAEETLTRTGRRSIRSVHPVGMRTTRSISADSP